MQQLGAGFMTTFLLPYIKTQILGNVDNDTRLQNMIRYDKVLRPDELSGLEDDYFQDTGTILETDAGLRKAFWKEFYEFIQNQKNLCNGNVLKLAFRLLPDAKSGIFSEEALQNLQKFSFYAVNKLEDTLIQREIDQKEVLGKISASEAADDRADLKEGKMILVRKQDGKFDYLKDPEVARALGNVKRTAEMLANLQTEETQSGEKKVYTFNPIEVPEGDKEVSSSPQEVQKLLWRKQSIGSEKQLEKNGLYVEGSMTIDANGIAHGFVKDKNNIRLRVDFDVKKPGEKMYRLTFVNNPDNKFFISEKELKSKFGDKKQSALDVYREKEGTEGGSVGLARERGTRIKGGGIAEVKLPENRKIVNPQIRSKVEQPESQPQVMPYVPPVTQKSGGESKGKLDQESQQKTRLEQNVMENKRRLANRMGASGSEVTTKGKMKGGEGTVSPGKTKAAQKRKKKILPLKVLKYYLAGTGGIVAAGGIASFFT